MTQMQIEQLCIDEYSYYLGHGQLDEVDQDDLMFAEIQNLLGDEESYCNDERELPQGFEDVCSSQGYDCF
jgi:hypothetical protein